MNTLAGNRLVGLILLTIAGSAVAVPNAITSLHELFANESSFFAKQNVSLARFQARVCFRSGDPFPCPSDEPQVQIYQDPYCILEVRQGSEDPRTLRALDREIFVSQIEPLNDAHRIVFHLSRRSSPNVATLACEVGRQIRWLQVRDLRTHFGTFLDIKLDSRGEPPVVLDF